MKANEFRLGNYVWDDIFIYQIWTINEDTVWGVIEKVYNHSKASTDDYYRGGDYNLNIENLAGIPLSEEWLLKFGFGLLPWGFVIKGNEDKAVLIRHSYKPNLKLWVEVGNGLRTELKYVHQLQNLFFALTGTELEIK